MDIIGGKDLSEEIRAELREANAKTGLVPLLAIIVVGDDRENLLYIGLKQRAMEAIGGKTRIVALPSNVSKDSLLEEIELLNADAEIHGILLQLPLPAALIPFQEEFLEAISPQKDVDGFNPSSRGRLMGDQPGFISCAALACMEVSRRFATPLKGKSVLLVGDSFDVIQPLAILFLKESALVTTIPRFDPVYFKQADITVIEKGNPLLVKDGAKPGSLLIDAGFHFHQEHMCGNVDRDAMKPIDGHLLAVPGGMGPILIAELLRNVCEAAQKANRGGIGE